MSQQTENNNIANFVKHMTEKNYAEANKYLHAVLEDKMKKRIADSVSK